MNGRVTAACKGNSEASKFNHIICCLSTPFSTAEMDAKDRPKKPSFASIVHRILAARSPEHLPLKDEAQKQTSEITSEELSGYETTRRYDKSKTRAHRKGPAPIEDFNKNLTSRKPTIVAGTLDSDAEDIDFRKDRSQEDNDTIKKKKSRNRKITPSDENLTIMASSKGLVLYFAKIGKSNADRIDLKFVEALIEIGADINSSDKHGQAAFHEVAREWHQDVASFLIDKGADINRADKYGRTPLHVASSVNYAKMITLLITNGGELVKFLQKSKR